MSSSEQRSETFSSMSPEEFSSGKTNPEPGPTGCFWKHHVGKTDILLSGKAVEEMNTYRLESKSPFQSGKVQTIIEDVLVSGLQEVTYDPQTAPALAMTLSAAIRSRVKTLQFDRYKLVCVVEIGEKQQQSVYSAFRFLWDADRDRYAMHRYENFSLFAVGLCFGVYHE